MLLWAKSALAGLASYYRRKKLLWLLVPASFRRESWSLAYYRQFPRIITVFFLVLPQLIKSPYKTLGASRLLQQKQIRCFDIYIPIKRSRPLYGLKGNSPEFDIVLHKLYCRDPWSRRRIRLCYGASVLLSCLKYLVRIRYSLSLSWHRN